MNKRKEPIINMISRVCVILLAGLASLSADIEQKSIDTEALRKTLLSSLLLESSLPVLSCELRYQEKTVLNYSAESQTQLLPQIVMHSLGFLDAANGKLSFNIQSLEEREGASADKYIKSTGHITFDGMKWIYIRSVEADWTPEVTSLTNISSEPPYFLAQELIPFGFPLLANFLRIHYYDGKERMIPLLEILSDNDLFYKIGTIANEGPIVKVTLNYDSVVDTLMFDATKGMALVERVQTYKQISDGKNLLENHWKVNDFQQVGEAWFPKLAEMSQIHLGIKKVERNYEFNFVNVKNDTISFDVSIPPKSIVSDYRLEINFITN